MFIYMAYLTKEACLIINAEDCKLNFVVPFANSAAILLCGCFSICTAI